MDLETRCLKIDELLGINHAYDISKRAMVIDNKKANL